jgi:hypothetical protein
MVKKPFQESHECNTEKCPSVAFQVPYALQLCTVSVARMQHIHLTVQPISTPSILGTLNRSQNLSELRERQP